MSGTSKARSNFTQNGKDYLLWCPQCKRENYLIAVSTGICVWCGYVMGEPPQLEFDFKGETNE